MVHMIHRAYFEVEEVGDEVKQNALWNGKIPLEEFLIYYAFYEGNDQKIPQMALEILEFNCSQRQKLF